MTQRDTAQKGVSSAFQMLETARQVRTDQNARNLWAVVLCQAVEDFLTNPPDLRKYKKKQHKLSITMAYERQRDRVTMWLFSSARRDMGAFLWVCEVLDLDPQAVRKGVHLRKLEHPV